MNELSKHLTGRNGLEIKMKSNVLAWSADIHTENFKFGHFTSLFRKGRQTNMSRLKRHVRGVQHTHSFMRALFFSYQILLKCKFLPSTSQ